MVSVVNQRIKYENKLGTMYSRIIMTSTRLKYKEIRKAIDAGKKRPVAKNDPPRPILSWQNIPREEMREQYRQFCIRRTKKQGVCPAAVCFVPEIIHPDARCVAEWQEMTELRKAEFVKEAIDEIESEGYILDEIILQSELGWRGCTVEIPDLIEIDERKVVVWNYMFDEPIIVYK